MTVTTTETRFSRACSFLLLGNLLDGLFTFAFLQLGYVQEVNPLMRWFYSGSPLSFMLFKLFTVQLGLLVLWMHRCRRVAVLGVHAMAGVYSMVVAYHCSIAASLPV